MRAQPISVLVVALFIGVVALPALAIAQSTSKSPRTPWGDPDLQGDWTSQSELGVPFERAAEFGTRQELSDEEFAKAAQRLSAERSRQRGVRSRDGRSRQCRRRRLSDVAATALARTRESIATDVDGDRSARWPSAGNHC